MSIRIQNDSVAGALETARPNEISNAISSSNATAVKSGNRGGDSVHLSSLSQTVAAAGRVQDAEQTARTNRLAALYRSGQYQIDSAQVSHAMVSQAISGGLTENG